MVAVVLVLVLGVCSVSVFLFRRDWYGEGYIDVLPEHDDANEQGATVSARD